MLKLTAIHALTISVALFTCAGCVAEAGSDADALGADGTTEGQVRDDQEAIPERTSAAEQVDELGSTEGAYEALDDEILDSPAHVSDDVDSAQAAAPSSMPAPVPCGDKFCMPGSLCISDKPGSHYCVN